MHKEKTMNLGKCLENEYLLYVVYYKWNVDNVYVLFLNYVLQIFLIKCKYYRMVKIILFLL
jgi:hypothetical protein